VKSQVNGPSALLSGQKGSVTVSGSVTCDSPGLACQMPTQVFFTSLSGQETGQQFVTSISSHAYSIKLSNDNNYEIQLLPTTTDCTDNSNLLVNTTQSSMTDDLVCY
jgi:hypothetical protein